MAAHNHAAWEAGVSLNNSLPDVITLVYLRRRVFLARIYAAGD